MRLVPLSSPRLANACAALGDPPEGLARILQAANSGRVGFRSDNHEVVVHHVAAIDAVAVGHELVLACAIMHQQRIGIAARADRQRLPGADRDHVNIEAAAPRETAE